MKKTFLLIAASALALAFLPSCNKENGAAVQEADSVRSVFEISDLFVPSDDETKAAYTDGRGFHWVPEDDVEKIGVIGRDKTTKQPKIYYPSSFEREDGSGRLVVDLPSTVDRVCIMYPINYRSDSLATFATNNLVNMAFNVSAAQAQKEVGENDGMNQGLIMASPAYKRNSSGKYTTRMKTYSAVLRFNVYDSSSEYASEHLQSVYVYPRFQEGFSCDGEAYIFNAYGNDESLGNFSGLTFKNKSEGTGEVFGTRLMYSSPDIPSYAKKGYGVYCTVLPFTKRGYMVEVTTDKAVYMFQCKSSKFICNEGKVKDINIDLSKATYRYAYTTSDDGDLIWWGRSTCHKTNKFTALKKFDWNKTMDAKETDYEDMDGWDDLPQEMRDSIKAGSSTSEVEENYRKIRFYLAPGYVKYRTKVTLLVGPNKVSLTGRKFVSRYVNKNTRVFTYKADSTALDLIKNHGGIVVKCTTKDRQFVLTRISSESGYEGTKVYTKGDLWDDGEGGWFEETDPEVIEGWDELPEAVDEEE